MPFPKLPDAATVVLTEIMYHPVRENADEDLHEFIEIYNRGAAPVALKGWKLEATGGLTFTFPDDATIGPKQYRVIAKSPKALAGVTSYGLMEGALWGPYMGGLDNGGATVSLKDGQGTVVDSVRYNDAAPWPIAADALGVKEDWLPDADKPMDKHRYRGRSLERISVDGLSNHPANWEASALDAATPGKANGVAGEVHPVVERVGVTPEGGAAALIRKADRAVVNAIFSDFGKVEGVQIEFFDDDPQRSGEATMTMPMTFDAASKSWRYTFPAKNDHTLVRYRILAVRDGKPVQVAPRATDPGKWHAYFVTPTLNSPSRVYHLFISSANWLALENNVAAGRESGCTVNPNWQKSVPAVFVHDGKVYDVFARYNGSRYQRRNGGTISNWPAPGPTGKTVKALSWKIRFPNYAKFEGYQDINLNKQWQGCPGTVSMVENNLLAKAGLPAQRVRFARLHINGAYYHYMTELERIDEELVARWLKPGEKMGEIYKDDGAGGDAGPHARGDFTPINENVAGYCGGRWTLEQRYAATYERVNHDHRSYADIRKLIGDLRAAKNAGSAAVKEYFTRYWDVDALLTSYAIRNWTGVWDDTFHNYYLYKRASDGKWLLIQQDFEWTFGLGGSNAIANSESGLAPWNARETFYIGVRYPAPISQQCEINPPGPWLPNWRAGNCNALGYFELKDLLIQNYRAQFDDKLRALSKTILSPAAVKATIDEAIAQFNMDDWRASPAAKACNPAAQHDVMKTWVDHRHQTLVDRLKP